MAQTVDGVRGDSLRGWGPREKGVPKSEIGLLMHKCPEVMIGL